MEYKSIVYEKEGNIAKITLNRPEKLNAIDFPGQGGINDEFQCALTEAENDDDIKVVIIKGAGRAFSAGHDLEKVGYVYGMKGERGERINQRIRYKIDKKHFGEFYRRLFLFPKITIAQVHGYCLAEGLILVECCDLAIAAEDAKLGHPETRLGGVGIGILPVLIATIGLKRATELMYTGRAIDGKEAERIGLVNKAVPVDQLDEEVNKLAILLSRLPRDGIAIGKAARQIAFDSIGLTSAFTQCWVFHTAGTNLHWEADEYNFFKARRSEGVRDAVYERDEFFKK